MYQDMNIYSLYGTRVKFHKSNRDHSSFVSANETLEDGKIYTVDFTVVQGWRTDVYLVEITGNGFNSVLFEEISD